MRKLLLAAVAATAIATPAMARDGSPYVGIEGGALWAKDFVFADSDTFTDGHKRGWEGAKVHYTRYYDEKTWKFVFGEDRPW